MNNKTTYISNDDLYNQFPYHHTLIIDNNSNIITEDNYPQVEGFTVVKNSEGVPVEFHAVHWSDGSETPLSGEED